VFASAFPFLFTCSLVQILCITASSGLDAGARHWLFVPAALAIDIYSVFGPAGRALEMVMAWEVGVSDEVELGDEGEKVGGREQRAKEGRSDGEGKRWRKDGMDRFMRSYDLRMRIPCRSVRSVGI
jgi:hypothetical protein